MFKHVITLMKPEDGFHYRQTITFNSAASDYKEAVISFIKKREEYHNYFILEADTLAPITFDVTVYLKGGNFAKTGKPYPNDFFACTFSEFNKQIEHYQNESEIFDHFGGTAFCRVLRSEGGKAGEFFMRHNERFRNIRMKALEDMDKPSLKYSEYDKAFTKGNYLNSPDHYFK